MFIKFFTIEAIFHKGYVLWVQRLDYFLFIVETILLFALNSFIVPSINETVLLLFSSH